MSQVLTKEKKEKRKEKKEKRYHQEHLVVGLTFADSHQQHQQVSPIDVCLLMARFQEVHF